MGRIATQRGEGVAQPILHVENIVKDFGGIRAVDGCTFSVAPGSITGLIGPNGAGKTTAFHIVTGFLKADQGTVSFRGEPIDGLLPHQIFRKGIARTFQIPRELRLMTVLENLMLVPLDQVGERFWNAWFRPGLVRSNEGAIARRAREILEFVELIHLENELAANLSVGQKKLLELARVLMADPAMILLDEPTAGVNPTLMNKLAGFIKTLRERGRTFLLIEHNMDLIADLCDTVIVMNNGRQLVVGPPEEVRNHPEVLEAYLGRRDQVGA